MKRLILTIVVVILSVWVSGCVVVSEHRHEHVRHAVATGHRQPVVIRPVPAPRPPIRRPVERRQHRGSRYTHR